MYSLHFTPNQCNLTASQSTALISSDSSDQNEDCIEYPDICLPFKNTQSSFHPMSYEIDVKPKRKNFETHEEKIRFIADYKSKNKTELCKNWTLKGSCVYSDNCCFAHGKEELKLKGHLHPNYKTKPCKQYFLNGFCHYGIRCQYMHNEIKQNPEKIKQFKVFLKKSYKEQDISINFLVRKELNFCLKLKKLENLIDLEQKNDVIPCLLGNRLPIFNKTCYFTISSEMKFEKYEKK